MTWQVFTKVPSKALIQAVKRNSERFPNDFMFQLNDIEFRSLRSQIVTLEKGRDRYPKQILPDEFSRDTDPVARFQREAESAEGPLRLMKTPLRRRPGQSPCAGLHHREH